jgi:hypothetical protein
MKTIRGIYREKFHPSVLEPKRQRSSRAVPRSRAFLSYLHKKPQVVGTARIKEPCVGIASYDKTNFNQLLQRIPALEIGGDRGLTNRDPSVGSV